MNTNDKSSAFLFSNPWLFFGTTFAWTWVFWGLAVLLLMRTLKTMSMASGESHRRLDEWPVETTEPGWQALYRVVGVAAFVQLACTLMTILIFYTVGGEPGTVDEYFTVRSQRMPVCWPMGLIGFMSCLASFCLESQTCS